MDLPQKRNDDEVRSSIREMLNSSAPVKPMDISVATAIKDAILQADQYIPSENINDMPSAPVHRLHYLKTAWFRYSTSPNLRWASAAAILILFGIGAYLYNLSIDKKPSIAGTDVKHNSVVDIAPGGNKALLTLADGSTIVLDSAANGQLAVQGNTQIVKLDNGQINYKLLNGGSAGISVGYNLMSTPRGGQYQLRLPDGTNVWLNASSSIRYPTVFNGNEREVTITGEAYFEVAKNPDQPFIVKTYKETIKVLGTHFNVNAYQDEENIKTSLIEGAVQIANKILKPGEAYINGNVIKTDVQQDIAWKNGYFNFQDKKLTEVMKELSRWYDINVIYEPGITDIEFVGDIRRNLPLSKVLEGLKDVGVHFTIENGKTIRVKP